MLNSQLRTGDQALVRDINQTLILNQIRRNARISRAGLSDMTGLNKATVSHIVRDLLETNFIREVGLHLAKTGRPSIMLELNPDAGCIIGAEIGVDFIAVIRTNFLSEIQWRHREAIDKAASSSVIAAQLVTIIEHAMEDPHRNNQPILGIAAGVPGLVDHLTGDVLFAPNLDWHDVKLASLLTQDLPLPIYLDNEANMAALGEFYFGAAQGHKNVLYLSLDAGLGGGIIYNERLFNGSAGFAGEFGHISMDPNGRLCKCGNRGCFETLVSLSTVYDYIKKGIDAGQPSLLSEIADQDTINFEDIVQAAHLGDPLSLNTFSTIGKALGTGLSNLVHSFDPDLIVLGGTLSLATNFMLTAVTAELTSRMAMWKRPIPEIVPARHTLDACVMGGIATVYDQIFNLIVTDGGGLHARSTKFIPY
jgi:glucokinase-like ROK family protein